MNVTKSLPLFVALATLPRLLQADYVPPTLADVSVYSTAIVDATVTDVTKDGFVTIEIHGYLKGESAPATVTGIWLADDGNQLPPELFQVNQRYVICLIRDQLYEAATFYPVRKTPAGELQCRYEDAAGLTPAEWVSLADFRTRLAEARKGKVVQDVVDVPGLNRPLWWLGYGEFDLAREPFYFGGEGAAPLMKHLEDIPRPWTMPILLAAYDQAARTAARRSEDEPQAAVDARYQRCFALAHVLAQTNDTRAVVALLESRFAGDEQIDDNAWRVLKASFGIDRQWLRGGQKLLAALDEAEMSHPLPAALFTPEQAVLAYANEKWFVWTLRDRFGNPRRRAIPYRTRYFRQRLGSETVELVYAMRGTYSMAVAVVLDDGTVVLGDTDQLVWVDSDGTTKKQVVQIPGPRATSHVVRGVPNGLLIEQDRLSGKTLYFVPISNGACDVAAARQLGAENGNKEIAPEFGRYYKRFGNLVTWMGYDVSAGTLQINTLDVKSRELKSVQPAAGGTLVASDGESFVLWTPSEYRLLSAKDGSTVSVIADRELCGERIFAVRNQIGYFFAGAGYNGGGLRDLPWVERSADAGSSARRRGEERKPATLVLTAVDFGAEGRGQTKPLMKITVTHAWNDSLGWFCLPFVPGTVTEEGLLLWNEGAWVTVPWLASLDQD